MVVCRPERAWADGAETCRTQGTHFLLLHHKLPQTSWLSSPGFCVLGGSGCGSAGSSAQRLSQAIAEVSARMGSYLKAQLGSASCSCWQDSLAHFLTDRGLEATLSSQLPAPPDWVLASSRQANQEGRRVGDQDGLYSITFAHVGLSRG